MTVFRPDTSFPYLKIAREYGVEYGEVIRFVEEIARVEGRLLNLPFDVEDLGEWQRKACLAWLRENARRSAA